MFGRRSELFLSYSRADDEPFVKRLYEDLSTDRNIWWDRVSMPSRGLTFTQEIRDAIDGCDRLLLIVGPHLLQSDYVRAEWEHALLFGKGVVPILRLGDYSSVPESLSVLHCPDFRESRPYDHALEELKRVLAEPVAELGPLLTAVPALPPHFLPRRDDLGRLRNTILADVDRPVVITSARQITALQGMGGIGKSVMASAFARATDTRRAFTDGVLWLSAGQTPDLLATVRLVAKAFRETASDDVEVTVAKARLAQLLERKASLVVLDDVWQADDATPIRDALGPRCRLLITTRDRSLVTALGAQEHPLDLLGDQEALVLLSEWSGQPLDALPGEALEVARECGNLPLALSLCGALVNDGVPWVDVRDALHAAEVESLDHPHGSVMKSLKVGVDALPAEYAQRYLELAVFPADESIPEAAVLRLWGQTGKVQGRQGRRLLRDLKNRALLRIEGKEPHSLVSLHDLQIDYVHRVAERAGNVKNLHQQLLEGYAKHCGASWPSGPDDGYYFNWLAHHLEMAGRRNELRELLLNSDWMRARLRKKDVVGLLADYALIPDDQDLELVREALRLSAHLLVRHPDILVSQLVGRLGSVNAPAIQDLLKSARRSERGSWIEPIRQTLRPVGGRLLRTLEGHSSSVHAVAVTPDGKRAVSGGDGDNDTTVRVWDLGRGELIRTLRGHCDCVNGVAVTPDGRRAVSVSRDLTLKVWNLDRGELIRSLEGRSELEAVAVTPDGRQAISGSADGVLKMWDLDSGEMIRALKGHSYAVRAVAVTPDGRRAVSGSADDTLKVWNLDRGTVIRTLQSHSMAVNAVAVTPDGRCAVSGSADDTLKVWDVDRGEVIHTLKGHTAYVYAVAVTPDGGRAVSGSMDRTLRVWDLDRGEVICTLEGHSGPVSAVAVTPDGKRAVSGAWDGTLRVWDLEHSQLRRTPEPEFRAISVMAVTPDGKWAVSGGGHTLRVWDLQRGEVIRTLNLSYSVDVVAITPDGKRAVSGSRNDSPRTLKVWDLERGEVICTLDGHSSSVSAVAVTPDGKRVVSGSDDKTLKIWDLEGGGMIRTLEGHAESVNTVTVTTDGERAVSGSVDGTLKIWDLTRGEVVKTLKGHSRSVCGVAVSSDSTRAVSGSWDGTLKLWDLERGEVIHTMDGPSITSVAMTPDGTRAVTGSGDQILRLWDLRHGERIASFGGDSPIRACGVIEDGALFLAAEASGRIHVLRLESARGRDDRQNPS